jgi:hypothetical protein
MLSLLLLCYCSVEIFGVHKEFLLFENSSADIKRELPVPSMGELRETLGEHGDSFVWQERDMKMNVSGSVRALTTGRNSKGRTI